MTDIGKIQKAVIMIYELYQSAYTYGQVLAACQTLQSHYPETAHTTLHRLYWNWPGYRDEFEEILKGKS